MHVNPTMNSVLQVYRLSCVQYTARVNSVLTAYPSSVQHVCSVPLPVAYQGPPPLHQQSVWGGFGPCAPHTPLYVYLYYY